MDPGPRPTDARTSAVKRRLSWRASPDRDDRAWPAPPVVGRCLPRSPAICVIGIRRTGTGTGMTLFVEDYAIIADTQTSALVGRNGSIDWLCVPRFDSGAIFASLLGDEENGHWTIAPVGDAIVKRRYRDETLVLETEFETADGVVRLTDF